MQFGKLHRFAAKNGSPPNPRDTLFARLTADLELLAVQHQLRPDLIICTGDLAEWGMATELADAFAFLGQLCEHYSLPRGRCIVVPGNHDINRFACESYFAECKGDAVEPVFPWFPKWKHFKVAFDAFYAGVPGITFDADQPWSLFADEDLRVVVAGLNSTIDEGHDAAVNGEGREDKGHHGLCTEPQLDWFKKRLGESRFEGWLRIGAVHHNTIRGCRTDNENLRDADMIGGVLGDHLHLLLHGHTHEAKADMLAAKVRVYSTGSASLKTGGDSAPVPTDIPNQYQFLAIKRESITRYCRQFAPRNTPPEFIADVRQSKTKSDWIIQDRVDFGNVTGLSSESETDGFHEEPRQNKPPLAARIPIAPAFYASPEYIGRTNFFGRKTQLKLLSSWAQPTDKTNVLLFEAIGGNGKSMLSWHWAKDENGEHATVCRPAESPWAGRFWYSFYEKGAVMRRFCQHALAYMTQQPLEAFEKKSTPEMRETLMAELRQKPWLIVLDGLERVLVAYHRIDAAEVRDEDLNRPTDKILTRDPCNAIRDEDTDLLRALASAAPSKILISSRLIPRALLNPAGLPLPGVRPVVLPGLDEVDAEELLRSCGVQGRPADIRYYLTNYCGNHPLVIGVLAGLINSPGPHRGNFDAWAADPDYGAKLNLASLDLSQSRNHILRAAMEALEPASRQLLSTLALLSCAADYETVAAFNPHLPPQPEEVSEPTPPESRQIWTDRGLRSWNEMLDEEKANLRAHYEIALAQRKHYELALQEWRDSDTVREAPKKLTETIADLESRGLLQYHSQPRRYDLHPVVRGFAAGSLQAEDKQRYGQRVVDHFNSQPHSPYEQAKTIEDVESGLQVVRTLLKLGHHDQAADAYQGTLSEALLFNLEAYVETLSLLRPFFPAGWDHLPKDVDVAIAGYLANDAAIALDHCGEGKQAFKAFAVTLRELLSNHDWINVRIHLLNTSTCLASQNHIAQALRMCTLAGDLADACQNESAIFSAQLALFGLQSRHGQWSEAEATWQRLDPMGRRWSRATYRQGHAEALFARVQFWQGRLEEQHLTLAATLAGEDGNRPALRQLHGLRGKWRLEQGEWALAAASLTQAVTMAREVRIMDEASETGVALARVHLGQLTGNEARNEAQRLAEVRQPEHRTLALLWLALGDLDQGKHHALAAYTWAWADGEPYVNRYELTKTGELLDELGVPIPSLPHYDPAQDAPYPWEAEVRAAIERVRFEMAAQQDTKQQDVD